LELVYKFYFVGVGGVVGGGGFWGWRFLGGVVGVEIIYYFVK